MWNGIIVEAGDVPELEREIDHGLAIGGEEVAVFRGVMVDAHAHVEGDLDVGYRAFDLDFHSVARAADDREAVSFRVTNDRVIVFLSGTKLGSEFLWCEEMAVRGAGGIVEFSKKTIEAGLIAQRQNDIEAQGLRCGQALDRFGFAGTSNFSHVMR